MVTTLTPLLMQSRLIVRVVLSGTTPQGTREEFGTTIAVSVAERRRGSHLEEARFRAGVRGLGAPWQVIADNVMVPPLLAAATPQEART